MLSKETTANLKTILKNSTPEGAKDVAIVGSIGAGAAITAAIVGASAPVSITIGALATAGTCIAVGATASQRQYAAVGLSIGKSMGSLWNRTCSIFNK